MSKRVKRNQYQLSLFIDLYAMKGDTQVDCKRHMAKPATERTFCGRELKELVKRGEVTLGTAYHITDCKVCRKAAELMWMGVFADVVSEGIEAGFLAGTNSTPDSNTGVNSKSNQKEES
jgi:hypothetical protein